MEPTICGKVFKFSLSKFKSLISKGIVIAKMKVNTIIENEKSTCEKKSSWGVTTHTHDQTRAIKINFNEGIVLKPKDV